jgi:RNA polymerase sigma-70 factor, ECF subfamily
VIGFILKKFLSGLDSGANTITGFSEENKGRNTLEAASNGQKKRDAERMRATSRMVENNSADRALESSRVADPEAFTTLFETYKDRVYSIALVFFKGDESAANDITQQVFLKLMSRLSQFENRAEFSTWLYRLVTNTCLDRHRSLKRWLFFGSATEAEHLAPPASCHSPEEEYSRMEISREVQAAISQLKPKFRIAILLKYFDDLSYEEMAVALQISKGTVASRLNRGHRMLAQKLAHLRSALGPEG